MRNGEEKPDPSAKTGTSRNYVDYSGPGKITRKILTLVSGSCRETLGTLETEIFLKKKKKKKKKVEKFETR